MKTRFILVLKVVVCLMIFKLLVFGMSELMALWLKNFDMEKEMLLSIYNTGNYLIMILIAFPIFVAFMKLLKMENKFDWKVKEKITYKKHIIYLGNAMLPVLIIYFLVVVLDLCNVIRAEKFLNSISIYNIIPELIFGCILMPIVEEIMFRGYILNSFLKCGDMFAIKASTVLFAIGHRNPVSLIVGVVAGCIFSYVALKYKGIEYGAYYHIIINMVGNIILPIIVFLIIR